jgi:hypothetical protein
MSERTSLADAAVDALAAVGRMDLNVTNEHDERHHIRTLKRLAETKLADAFREARELAWLAEDMHKEGERRRSGDGGGQHG